MNFIPEQARSYQQPFDEDTAFYENRRMAAEAIPELAKDSIYNLYAKGQGPLKLEEAILGIGDNEERIQAIHAVKTEFGWPGDVDNDIEPVPDMSDEELLFELFGHKLDDDVTLANFIMLLRQKPIKSLAELTPRQRTADSPMGLYPVLHRAYALMPDLMEALRITLKQHTLGSKTSRDALSANMDVMHVTNMAYHIMGRLVKINDFDDPVSSAQDALTTP